MTQCLAALHNCISQAAEVLLEFQYVCKASEQQLGKFHHKVGSFESKVFCAIITVLIKLDLPKSVHFARKISSVVVPPRGTCLKTHKCY